MILEHLKVHGSITQDEAKELYAVGRLSARILNLKEDGHDIKTITVYGLNRFGEKIRFAKCVYGSKIDGNEASVWIVDDNLCY
jgi:hypothetical protein